MCGMAGPTPKMGIQVLLPTENEPWKERLNWKDITGCKVQNHQVANRQQTDNLLGGTLPTKAIRSASILPEHCQMLQDHEEPQKEDKTTNVGKKQRIHVRFLPSLELTQLQEHFQEDNSDHYCKSRPQCSQPAQPSILNPKSYTLSKMMGTVPMEIPVRKVIAKCDIHNTVNKGHSAGDSDVPCTSSSTPGKELRPRNTEVRTDKLSSMNTTEDLSFLDPKSQMKLEPKIMQLPVKRRRKLPCISKAEYYAKAAMILERLHHQDPGGTRVETISTARLQNPLFEHSPSEVQGTQRAPPTASIHGPSKSHADPHQRYLSVQPHTFCFLAKPQQSRRLQGSGRSCLLPNTS